MTKYNQEYYLNNKKAFNTRSKIYYRKNYSHEARRQNIIEYDKQMKKLKELMFQYCGGEF